MSEVVLDASVAISLVVEEPVSDAARASTEDVSPVVPDIFWAEVVRALARKADSGDIDRDHARQGLELLERLVEHSLPLRPLSAGAVELSFALGHPTDDCFYLAAAVASDAVLVTADRTLHRCAARAGLGDRVHLVQ